VFLILLCLAVSASSCDRVPNEQPAQIAAPATAPSVANNVDQPQPAPVTAPEEVRSASPIIEADMSPELLSTFKDSKECRGVQLSTKGEKTRRDFRIHASFAIADTPEKEEQWLWTVFDTRRDVNGQFRAAGNASSAADAVRDICMEIWANFTVPNGRK